MAIKLVAVDLDGTLLDPQMNVTYRTQQAVEAALAHGIQVAICTGRMRPECAGVLQALPQVRYAICSSGGRVWDLHDDRILSQSCFCPEHSAALLDRLLRFDCMPSVFAGDRIRVPAEWKQRMHEVYTSALLEHFVRYYHPSDDLRESAAGMYGPVEKIFTVFLTQAERDRAMAAIDDIACTVATSGTENLELNAIGTDKGQGLHALAQHLGLDRTQVMAIGDSNNDTKMLTYAGVPVAMGNAEAGILNMASLIAPDNAHDGVAWVLERLVEGTLTWN